MRELLSLLHHFAAALGLVLTLFAYARTAEAQTRTESDSDVTSTASSSNAPSSASSSGPPPDRTENANANATPSAQSASDDVAQSRGAVASSGAATRPIEYAPPPNVSRSHAEYFRRRATTGPSAGDVALWIPRVLFAPLYFVTDFVIRRPLVATVAAAERHHIPAYLSRVFNPAPDFTWSPTVVVDLGLLTSGGLRLRWNNALVRGNVLTWSGATALRPDFWHFVIADTFTRGAYQLSLRGEYLTRPDRRFFGLGPLSELNDRVFYTLTRREAWAGFGFNPSHHFGARLDAGYRSETTQDGWEPVPASHFDTQTELPGYGDLRLFLASTEVTLDSRHDPSPATGVRLWLKGLFGQDVRTPERRFVVAEAEVSAAVEIVRPYRVLSVSAYAADSASLGSEPVPFTHLPTLGRLRHPGHMLGRYIGQSAALVRVAYRYPIWLHLDALWLVTAGNVFGEHFAGFDPRLFSGSAGVGVRTRTGAGNSLEIVLALGSSRFDQQFAVENVQLYFNLNQGL